MKNIEIFREQELIRIFIAIGPTHVEIWKNHLFFTIKKYQKITYCGSDGVINKLALWPTTSLTSHNKKDIRIASVYCHLSL